MNERYIVYIHIFPNGKQYVGITCQKATRRWRNGRGYYQNVRMTRAIQKYGWENIQHIILYEGLTQEEAEAIERSLISCLNLTDETKGYNYAEGGTHPRHSEKTRRKIGDKSKGRHHTDDFKRWISQRNSGAGNYMYGKHHTEETKQKISSSRKGIASVNKGKYGGAHPSAKGVIAIDPVTGVEVKR